MPQPSTTSHVGSTSPITTSHTGIKSPTYASHVGDLKPTSTSHVGDLSPASASHAGDRQLVVACHFGGTTLVTASHTGKTSPTSASHVGDVLLASASHAGSMSSATASYARGIDTIDKPRRIGNKTKFLCRLCKRDHLTRLCPVIAVLRKVRSLSSVPSGFESYLVSQHSNPSLVDKTVMPMQSSADTTPILGSDASLNHVVSHIVQPTIVLM
jgi:hypothetical protein